MKDLVDRDYKKIGQELEDEDPYRYHRVISPGTQEFIEALTLLEYMQTGQIKVNILLFLGFIYNRFGLGSQEIAVRQFASYVGLIFGFIWIPDLTQP